MIMVANRALRTSREDEALRQELPGYEEFTERTRLLESLVPTRVVYRDMSPE